MYIVIFDEIMTRHTVSQDDGIMGPTTHIFQYQLMLFRHF